jgi:hypothetical protein
VVLINSDKSSLSIIAVFGVILNLSWFFGSQYLEKMFFNKSYVWTTFIYLILFCIIITKLCYPKFKFFFLVKSLLFMVFGVLVALAVYFMSWNFGNEIITYCGISLTYLLFISIIFSKLPLIKIDFVFLSSQLALFITTIFVHNIILDLFKVVNYDIQILFSVWLIGISIYLANKIFRKRLSHKEKLEQ